MSPLDATSERQPQELVELRQSGAQFFSYRDDTGAPRAWVLAGDRVMAIGRGEQVDLRLAWDPSVSLVHAEVIPVGAHWLIADDGVSRNGTFVNGRRLSGRRRLRDGDLVNIGRTALGYNDARTARGDATTIGDARARTGVVTVLFTDLVGSTALIDRLGDDRGDRMLREHFSMLREVAREHAGQEVKSLGDGLMLAFESVNRALACAVTMQERTSRSERQRGSGSVALRIGLNAGEAISVDGDYFGRTVVIAKRLCDRAGDGEILVSGVARSLLAGCGEYRFRALGRLSLKGLSDPVSAFVLDWSSSDATAE